MIYQGQAIARLKEHIDIASILHCGVIIGSMRGRIPEGHKQDKRAMKNYSESLYY